MQKQSSDFELCDPQLPAPSDPQLALDLDSFCFKPQGVDCGPSESSRSSGSSVSRGLEPAAELLEVSCFANTCILFITFFRAFSNYNFLQST